MARFHRVCLTLRTSPACRCHWTGAPRRTFMLRSKPHSSPLTWHPPVDLSALPGSGSHHTLSPGSGLQLASGRIVFQSSHWKGDVFKAGGWKGGDHRFHAHVIFSTDAVRRCPVRC